MKARGRNLVHVFMPVLVVCLFVLTSTVYAAPATTLKSTQQVKPATSAISTAPLKYDPNAPPTGGSTPLYPNSGNGPLLSVSNWFPEGRSIEGGSLRIRGSNFPIGKTYVAIGGALLTPGSLQTPSEMLFNIPAGLLVPDPGLPLVIYQKGGQVRTLEKAYKVYPKPVMTKVEPASFKPGDTVKITGRSLFLVRLGWEYSPTPLKLNATVNSSSLSKGDFLQIDKYQLTGAKSVLMGNPVLSPAGDTLVFTVRGLYENIPVNYCWAAYQCAKSAILHPTTPIPASFVGPAMFYVPGGGYLYGQQVTWHP